MEFEVIQSETNMEIDRITKYLQRRPGIQAAYLFGSFATNRATLDSDIDLAVLFNTGLDWELLWQMRETLVDLSNRDVDLIDLRTCSPILAYQILKYGTQLFVQHEHALNLWVIQALNAYYDLKIDRIPIERSIINGTN